MYLTCILYHKIHNHPQPDWIQQVSGLTNFDRLKQRCINVVSTLFQRRALTLYQRCGTLKIRRRILFHFQSFISIFHILFTFLHFLLLPIIIFLLPFPSFLLPLTIFFTSLHTFCYFPSPFFCFPSDFFYFFSPFFTSLHCFLLPFSIFFYFPSPFFVLLFGIFPPSVFLLPFSNFKLPF